MAITVTCGLGRGPQREEERVSHDPLLPTRRAAPAPGLTTFGTPAPLSAGAARPA